MEGAAVTSQRMNPQSLLFPSPANDDPWFSLSHSYAQTPESDPVVRSNAPIFTTNHIHMRRKHFDLFLDFTEKFPHSSSQTDIYGD
jgi:hypothetical protein